MKTNTNNIINAIKTQAKRQLPYGISRFVMSATLIMNGFILKKLDDQDQTNDMVAAGSLISAVQFVLLGVGRGFLITTGLKVSEINGKQSHINSLKEGVSDFSNEYMQAITQSNAIALVICLLEVPTCWLMQDLVTYSNVNSTIAKNMSNYFKPFSFGLLPYYLLLIDNQIALAKGKSHITLYSGILFSLVWLISSYSLSFGCGGIPALSISGIGLGFSISSLINSILLHSYLCLTHHKPCNPFPFYLDNFFHGFTKQVKDGSKLALQRLAEWGNVALLAFVFGSYGKDKLIAQQAPLQLTYMITTSILAMIQAQATIVRKQLSEAECLLDRNDVINGEIKYDQAILSANAGLGTGITVSSMIAVLIIIANKALSELFMDTKQMQNNDISTSCNTLFTICSISIVLDGIRNFSTGALRGLGELSKPPMISAVAIFSCICLGIVLGRLDLLQPASLYIMRAVGIVISAGLIMKQWNMKSRIHLQDIMKKFRLNDDRSNLLTSYSTFSNVVADKRIKETDIERGLLNNGTELYPKPV